MFWIIAIVVIVAAFAVAWWTSGRAKPRRRAIDPSINQGYNDAGAQHQRNDVQGKLGPP